MKKTLIMSAALLAAVVSFAADQVIDLSKPAAWTGKNIKAGKEAGTLSVTAGTQISTKAMFPVDAKHTYDFSGIAYAPAGKANSRSYCGYLLYDKNKRYISQINAVSIKGSTTELVEPVAKGANTLKIKANNAWKVFGHFRVGFNVEDGKLCKDFSYSSIKSIKKEGNNMVVTLNIPLGKAYPAGTKVRIQTIGGYFYSNSFSVNSKDTKFAKPLKKDQLWLEAAYLRPMILVNWSLPQGTPANKIETVYKNLKLTIKEIK